MDWDLGGLGLLLALGLASADWVWAACGGGSGVGGVAVTIGLVVVPVGGLPPAATRQPGMSWGGRAVGAGWVAIGGVGSMPWMVPVWAGGVVDQGVALVGAVAGLRLP